MLPGSAFGGDGTDHLRMSYANSQANLLIALERMADLPHGATDG